MTWLSPLRSALIWLILIVLRKIRLLSVVLRYIEVLSKKYLLVGLIRLFLPLIWTIIQKTFGTEQQKNCRILMARI
jgi:hypothetical protein